MRPTPVADANSVTPARPRREGPPADPLAFPALLEKTTARTAPAEGHTAKPQSRRRGESDDAGRVPAGPRSTAADASPSTDGDPGLPTVPGATAPEPATAPDPAAVDAVGGTAIPPAAASGAVAGGVTIGAPGAPGTPAPDADDLPAVTPGVAPTVAPAATAAASAEPSAGPGVATGSTGDDGLTPGMATSATPGDTPVIVPGVARQGAPDGPGALADPGTDEAESGAGPAIAPDTPVGTDSHEAAGGAGTQRRGDGPAALPTPTAPAASAAVPATPTAPASITPVPPGAWVSRGLAHTVERLQDLVHVATARGVARAKLQLHPQELGGIEVRLRTSDAGLVATITAQNAEAVHAVTQAGAELRRSLEERGITIASLDIGIAADGRSQHGWQRRPGDTGSGSRREVSPIAADPTTTTTDDDLDATGAPAGALVDVHA